MWISFYTLDKYIVEGPPVMRLQVSPLSDADRQELQRLTQQYQQKKQQWEQKKQQLQQEHPLLGWAMWVFKPPGPRSSKAELIVKRVVMTPFK